MELYIAVPTYEPSPRVQGKPAELTDKGVHVVYEPSPRVRGKHFLARLNAWSSRKIDSLYVFPYVGWV